MCLETARIQIAPTLKHFQNSFLFFLESSKLNCHFWSLLAYDVYVYYFSLIPLTEKETFQKQIFFLKMLISSVKESLWTSYCRMFF